MNGFGPSGVVKMSRERETVSRKWAVLCTHWLLHVIALRHPRRQITFILQSSSYILALFWLKMAPWASQLHRGDAT